MQSDYLPAETVTRVEAELLDNEEVLWVGQPAAGTSFADTTRMSKLSAVAAVLLSLLVGGFIWLSQAAPARLLVVILIAVVLAGVILAMLAGRGLTNFWRARHTIYAVTNRRALIIDRKAVQSFRSNDIEFIERRMSTATRGDIIFKLQPGSRTAYYGGGAFYGEQSFSTPIGFFGIENAREVERLMLEIFRPSEQEPAWAGEKRKHELENDEPDVATDGELPLRKKTARS